jgi:site-specific recombinase XerD
MSKLAIPAGRNRYLTPGHITFFRAAMEGVELRRCWEYVELDEDEFTPALAKATVQWIRETTIAACMSAGHPELVGLFRRDPDLVKVTTLPSLDEFIAEFQDGDAFSEQEMLELYKERYGINRSAERRSRLQARLRQAFDLLAKSVYRAPKASDPMGQWLAPHLAEHLQAVGMRTLADVRAALNKRRTARWDEVPGIGEKWAARLTRWMDEHVIVVKPEGGFFLMDCAQPPSPFAGLGLSRVQRSDDFVEVLPALPSSASASASPNSGQVRSPYPASQNRLGANSDADAIELWIRARAPDNHNTQRSYRRASERLLLWCQLERGITFAQMRAEDCIHYRAWLTDLGRKTPEEWATAGWKLPAEQWLGRRGIPRDSADWRPFEGSMAKTSVAQDLTILRSLFNFLQEGRVVDGNPWLLMGKGNFSAPFGARDNQFTSRSLTVAQRDYLLSGLDLDDEIDARLNLILWLGFGCGLRSSELLGLTFSSLKITPERWSLEVIGKGDKLRSVPLSTPVKTALLHYMSSIGISLDYVIRASSGLDEREALQPILRTQRGRRARGIDGRKILSTPSSPMSYQSLHRVLTTHFDAKATTLEAQDPISAARLKEASAHWLRHSCAVQALKKVPLNGVQKLLGHASIAVTGRYVVENDEALADAMEEFLAPN